MSSLASLLWATGFHLSQFGADTYFASEQCLYIAHVYHFLIVGQGQCYTRRRAPPRGPLGAGVPSQACSTPFTVRFCL